MRARHVLAHVRDDTRDLVRQRAAVGVAQHDPACPGLVGGRRHRQRIGAIGLVAVEEVLAVEHGLAVAPHYGFDRLGDPLQVLLVGNAERHPDVVVPSLRNETDGAGMRLQGRLEARVVGHRASRALGHAECCEGSTGKPGIAVEEVRVGRIGSGVAALDVVDADLVERARDQPLVLEREIDASRLRAVAQRRVEQVEPLAGHDLALFNNRSMAARNRSIVSRPRWTASTLTVALP